MQFGADDGGEVVGAHGAGIRHGPVVVADEVVRQHHEIIAGVLVGFDDLRRLKSAIREIRMGMQVAAPEAAGKRER